ncbi:MAG: hypothetical protein WA705_03545 [Candidatus Ozemobacteraceae bacterium]
MERHSLWNIWVGREKGEAEADAEGIRTMKTLGVNMAWLQKKINQDVSKEFDACTDL